MSTNKSYFPVKKKNYRAPIAWLWKDKMENEKNLGSVYLSLPSRDHYNKVRKLLCKEKK